MDGSIEVLLDTDPGTLSHEDRLGLLVELDRLAARVAARSTTETIRDEAA